MNQNSVNKRKSEKNKENKEKEDEERLNDTLLSADIVSMNYSQNLDLTVSVFKMNNIKIDSFDQYMKKISKITSSYSPNSKELDYRYAKLTEGSDQMKVDLPEGNQSASNLEKMKLVGKLGEGATFMETEASISSVDLENGKLKVTANNRSAHSLVTSVRANNCVFKGKWCYEVTLLSKGSAQLGWCQFNTPSRDGQALGDDNTSYSYDGCKMRKRHTNTETYGKRWDIGDVIGVCLDLESKTIEFFQNGVSLGQAFTNVLTGPNLAYFPALSLSQNERILFNFGGSQPIYIYPGYDFFDIPPSYYKNTYDITKSLIAIVEDNLIKFLQLDEMEAMYKFNFSYRVFNFLVNVSFKDYFTLTNLLIPFMIENLKDLSFFIEYCLLFTVKKVEFVTFLFDSLSSYIEYFSVKKFEGMNEYEQLVILFLNLLNNKNVAQLWLEGKKYVSNLKCIINGNFLHYEDIIQTFENKKPENANSNFDVNQRRKIFGDFYFKTRTHLEEKYENEGMLNYDHKMKEIIKTIIQYFSNDERLFRVGSKELSMKAILIEMYPKLIKESSTNDREFLFSNGRVSMNEPFLKLFYFNLLDMLSESLKLEFSEFSVEPWLHRSQRESIYYDQTGLGGSISHVTTEYIHKVDASFKVLNNNHLNYMFHHLLHMTSSILIPSLFEINQHHDIVPRSTVDIMTQSRESSKFYKNIRTYLSVFTKQNQILLYQFSYFLVKWLNTLIQTNKELIYFLPKSVMIIPYEIFRLLVFSKSQLIGKEANEMRRKANSISPHFQNDDYIYQMMYFYSYLLYDENIANPELKELFMQKVTNFLKIKLFKKEFEENDTLMELLMKGMIKNMGNEIYSIQACDTIVELIKPCLFGETGEKTKNKTRLLQIVTKFFKSNVEAFHEFIEKYYKLLNKVMTDFTLTLSDVGRRLQQKSENLKKSHTMQRLISAYDLLFNMVRIFEFLLLTYPDEFFDIENVNFTRFSNVLKNISSRILDKPYFEKLVNYLNIYFESSASSQLCHLSSSVIGIFISIHKFYKQEDNSYTKFVNKLVSLSDFDVEPFYSLANYKKPSDELKKGYDQYKEILDVLTSLKVKKVEKKMTESEWEETVNKENICIICYVNIVDKILLPCRHVCCNECLMQYLIDKKNCFICNTLIESTNDHNFNNK